MYFKSDIVEPSAEVIAGAVIGGIVAIITIIVCVMCLRKTVKCK